MNSYGDDVEAGLAEVRRVLSPNGRLVVGNEAMKFATDLLEPVAVERAPEAAGFLDVEVSSGTYDNLEMFVVEGRAPAGELHS